MADNKNEDATGKQKDREDQQVALNSEQDKAVILSKVKPPRPKR